MSYKRFSWDEVRKRNLRISIAKGLITEKWSLNRSFSNIELRNVFRFKASDMVYYANAFFHTNKEAYTLFGEEKEYIDKILKSNKAVSSMLKSADAYFVAEFESYCNDFFNVNIHFQHDLYVSMIKKLVDILPVLHWGHLPIFDKWLLYNCDINPEKHVEEFYDNFDCLKALLEEIKGRGQKMQIHSDDTLEKDLMFEVYTRRWNHSDCYRMRRTISGWECSHISISGKCEKNGEGALFKNLNHDSVFFPEEAVKQAMEELWEAADEGEIDLEELQKRLQQVADWISHVEKAVVEKQPGWLKNY